jgi:iron complex outermembrane receptor protein
MSVAVPVMAQDAPATQAASPAPAAQDAGSSSGLEEIVVTAQRRSENLRDTPIAITAITASALEAQGITDLGGVVQASPSLYFAPYPSSSTTLVLFMRGQGTGDPMQITKDGGIGLYVDGIYQPRPQNSTFDLADVERVEVLRGPQGTLYGRNTSGGAVNIISTKPTGEFGVSGQLSLGNLNYQRGLLNVNLPEFAGFKIKLTGLFSHRDGWALNASDVTGVPEAHDFQADRKVAFRGAIRWEPTPDITIDYAGDYSNIRTTPVRYVNESPFASFLFPGYTADTERSYRPVYLPYSTTKSDGHSLVAEFRVADGLTLRSLTGYRHLSYTGYQDYTESFLVPFYSRDYITSRAWSQEFQAVGEFADQFKYVVGLYYFDERARQAQSIDIGTGTPGQLVMADRDSPARAISRAAFGQLTWTPQFTDGRFDITLGARYTSDTRRASRVRSSALFIGDVSPLVDRQFNGAGTVIDLGGSYGENELDNTRFSPSIVLAYRPTDNVSTYAKVVTGYRAGGSQQSSPNFSRTFGPETVTSYEIGLKSDLFDRRLRFNISGYIAKYKDLQLDISADPLDLSVTDTFNAGRATVRGIETEITAAPTDWLTLAASYTYTESSIKNVIAPANTIFDPAFFPATPTQVGQDVSGYFVLPFTPKHSLRLSADVNLGQVGPGELSFNASYTWKDSVYTSSGAGRLAPMGRNFSLNPAYDLVDARLTYRIERGDGSDIAFSLWGKNIFDSRYAGFNIGFGSPVTGYSAQALSYGDPATYGVDVSFRF